MSPPRRQADPPKAQLLIDAGLELMREHYDDSENTLGAGFQFISPTQVAGRAGMSKGMLYHIWGRDGGRAFDNYVAELAERVLDPLVKPDVLRHAIHALFERGLSFPEATAAMGDFELGSIVSDADRRTAYVQTLSLTAYAGCRVIRDALDASSQRSYEQLAEFYDFAFGIYGRRIRRHDSRGRSMTTVDFARAVSCLVEGFAAEALHSPQVLEPEIAWTVGRQHEPSSLLAISLMSLVDGLTEEIPPDEAPQRTNAMLDGTGDDVG